MASKNDNDCASNEQTPDTVVCDVLQEIRNEQTTTQGDKDADATTISSKITIKGYKICCLKRAEETHDVYQDLMSCVTLGQYKKTEIIQQNIDEYIKKDDDIEKLITESSALLNDLCTKLVEANDELCTMSNCVKNKVLSKSSKVTAKDKENIEECLEEITNKSKDLVDKGKNAVESIVTIAGIQTYTNTVSLKELADAFMEKMTALKDCTEENIGSTAEEVTVIREELNTIVQELAEIECDYASACTTIEGLQLVEDFICKCDCDGKCLDLCEEFEKCCKKSGQEPPEKTPQLQKTDQD